MDAVNVGGTPPAFFRNVILAPTALPATTSVLLSPSMSRRNSVVGCTRVVEITLPLNVGGEPPRFLKRLTRLDWKDTTKLGYGGGAGRRPQRDGAASSNNKRNEIQGHKWRVRQR